MLDATKSAIAVESFAQQIEQVITNTGHDDKIVLPTISVVFGRYLHRAAQTYGEDMVAMMLEAARDELTAHG